MPTFFTTSRALTSLSLIKKLRAFHYFWMLIIACLCVSCSDPGPIKVGFVGAISGRRSEVSVSARNAVQIKVNELNKAGGIHGRPIELVIKDNFGDPKQCGKELNELISQKVPFILGPIFSQMAEITLQSIKNKDVLVMSPTMSTDFLTGKDDNLLRTSNTTSQQAELLAKLAQAQNIKTVACVYDLSNRKYTELLYNKYKEFVEKAGISMVLTETIPVTKHPKMEVLAQKIIDANPDGLLMCVSAIDAANLAQQLHKKHAKIKMYGVSWSQTIDLIQQGGKAVEGMHLIALEKSKDKSDAYKAFNKKYHQKFSTQPSFAAFRAYDAATLLFAGIAEAPEITPTQVKKTILEHEPVQGLMTTLKLNKFGDIHSGYGIVTVQNSAFVLINPLP